jgi:hypothetical protein
MDAKGAVIGDEHHFSHYKPVRPFVGITGEEIDASAVWNASMLFYPQGILIDGDGDADKILGEEYITVEMSHIRFWREKDFDNRFMRMEAAAARAATKKNEEAWAKREIEHGKEENEMLASLSDKFCEICHGEGVLPDNPSQQCSACNGSGQVPRLSRHPSEHHEPAPTEFSTEGEEPHPADDPAEDPFLLSDEAFADTRIEGGVEEYPRYQELVTGKGCHAVGLLSPAELRLEVASCGLWHCSETTLPPFEIKVHEYLSQAEDASKWEYATLCHPGGRDVMCTGEDSGDLVLHEEELLNDISKLELECAVAEAKPGTESTLRALEQRHAARQEDLRQLRLEQSHPLFKTQFVLEYCLAVTPCRQGEQVLAPLLPRRPRRKPLVDEREKGAFEVSTEMLLCVGECYTTWEEIIAVIRAKLGEKESLEVIKRDVARAVGVDENKDFSFFINAPSGTGHRKINEIKKLLESPEYIPGVGVAKVMFLTKQQPM